MTSTRLEPTTTESVKENSIIWPHWANDLAELWVLICTLHLNLCSNNVTCAFQTESFLYICPNVKKLLARKRRDIWGLSDCKGTRPQNHLVRKETLNYLAKLTKWLSWIVSTYLYGASDCKFLSCHVRVSEWIHTLYFPECQGTLCSTEAWFEPNGNRTQNHLVCKRGFKYLAKLTK